MATNAWVKNVLKKNFYFQFLYYFYDPTPASFLCTQSVDFKGSAVYIFISWLNNFLNDFIIMSFSIVRLLLEDSGAWYTVILLFLKLRWLIISVTRSSTLRWDVPSCFSIIVTHSSKNSIRGLIVDILLDNVQFWFDRLSIVWDLSKFFNFGC